jgi:hypothetical protein
VADEASELAGFMSEDMMGLRAVCDMRFAGKDEAIQWYRANFVDKEAAEKIVRAIEKAYSE